MAILENCRKADIYSDTGELLYQAEVQTGPMDSTLVVVPRTFDFREQSFFHVVFYDPVLGLLTCRCTFSSPLNLPEQMCSLRCEILERLTQEQRRQDVKVPVGLKVRLQVPYRPGDPSAPKDGWPATVLNISAGGAYVRTEAPLKEGRKFMFTFQEASGDIPLTAVVLRVDDVSPHPGRVVYGYGCNFVGLSARYESQLRSFVFREERRLHKKD